MLLNLFRINSINARSDAEKNELYLYFVRCRLVYRGIAYAFQFQHYCSSSIINNFQFVIWWNVRCASRVIDMDSIDIWCVCGVPYSMATRGSNTTAVERRKAKAATRNNPRIKFRTPAPDRVWASGELRTSTSKLKWKLNRYTCVVVHS